MAGERVVAELAGSARRRQRDGTKKKAGRENGPAKKKVKTFRGEHRSAKWEENTERILLFWTDSRADTTNGFLKIG
jgi:hypothetical protein